MKRTRRGRIGLIGNVLLLSLLTVGGTGTSSEDLRADLEATTAARIEPFGSAGAFDEWVREVHEVRRRHGSGGCGGLVLGCAMSDSSEASAMPADESITNVQEDGVDEGGIVKVAGDYFVILRRGRLFTVRQETGGADDLVAVDQVDAYPDGWTRGTWYDELLVRGDRIVVVGYSYEVRATEVSLFRLEEDGRMRHEATHFIRSNDYYSSRNYASRLIGDTLIFYMPYRLFDRSGWGADAVTLPSTRSWVRGNRTSDWTPVVDKADVYQPVQGTFHPYLHTVVRCDLSEPELSCSGQSVVGPRGRNFYVTRDHIWLWVAPPWEASRAGGEQDAFLYRMPLGEGEVTALRARGMPIDQFSFLERDDHIHVVVVASGGGDEMWAPEVAHGDMALLRMPLSDLDASAPRAPVEAYHPLPAPDGGGLRNRFVGDHLLHGSAAWRDAPDSEFGLVFVTPIAEPDTVHAVDLGHGVDRIEVLGAAALVVGRGDEGLHFTSVHLGDEPSVASTFLQEGAVQGETRSHGFFFRPDGTGGGVLGLPVRYRGESWSHLRYGSAAVRFLAVSPDHALSSLGGLAATDADPVDDDCHKSCVDWYGNARPIFYRGRTFALMGYELVEGAVEDGAIEEVRRIDFFLGEE